jgi:hypothetical protein
MNESPEPNNGRVPSLVRMPAGLHRLIKDLADREHRSVNQQIVFMLDQLTRPKGSDLPPRQ